MLRRLSFLVFAAGAAVPRSCVEDQEATSLLQTQGRGPPFSDGPPTAAMLGGGKQQLLQPHEAHDDIEHLDWRHQAEHYREQLGLSLNGHGGLAAFLTAVSFNSAVVLAMILGFSLLRKNFPEVYSGNTIGDDPRLRLHERETTGIFGWYQAVRRILQNENLVEVSVGLDHCMLLEYTNFAMKLMTVIGLPLVLFLAPLHLIFGRGAVNMDLLDKIGFANVAVDSPICWVHGFVVWFVVCATQWLVFEAQDKFMDRRLAWLKRMPFPRANTILVERIEKAYCSDAKLLGYFNEAFDEDVVEEAYVVRNTSHLLALLKTLDDHKALLEDAQAKLGADEDSSPETLSSRPSHRLHSLDSHLGEEVDSIDHYTEKVATLEGEVAAERARIRDVVNGDGLNEAVFCSSGFVTFRKRVNCEHALKHKFSRDLDTFVVSAPPDPRDIHFPSLQADHLVAPARQVLGYVCVAGIFFSFLPLVAAISSVTSLSHLRTVVPFVDHIISAHPLVAQVWDALASSMMLSTLMSFVPLFLIMIFEHFFATRAETWMQHKVQQWYFCFLVVFVLLVTCIGSSLSAAVEDILENPSSIIWRMSDTLPQTTNFYLEFFLTQTAAHAGFLARISPLAKFLMFRPLMGAARAKELSEPEDQAYYGIGSRSATLTLLLVTALVFCTLQPLVCVLCFVFFALARLVYGNLFLLAETAKVDLGGVFWVTQLKQTQQGLVIYILLMCGVLFRRAESYGPGAIALSSLALLCQTYIRFDQAFPWESLPFAEVMETSTHQGSVRRKSLLWKPKASASSLAAIPEKSTSARRLSSGKLLSVFKASTSAGRYEQRELLEEL